MVVSNAASGVIRPVLELEEKHWDWTINANARALFTLARTAAPLMAPGSSIIAISSLGATRVFEDYVFVGISKAAIEALVRYLAVELAPRDIRVNAVSAGLVETGALEYFAKRDKMLSFFRGRTPAGRLVEPRDIADAVCFLASPGRDDPRPDTRRRRRLLGAGLAKEVEGGGAVALYRARRSRNRSRRKTGSYASAFVTRKWSTARRTPSSHQPGAP